MATGFYLLSRYLQQVQTDSVDRRVTRVVITEPGQAMRSDIRAALEQELSMRLPTADRVHLTALVHASATALADSRPCN